MAPRTTLIALLHAVSGHAAASAVFNDAPVVAPANATAGGGRALQLGALDVCANAVFAGRTTFAGGIGHTCVVTTGGSVACWGWDAYGQTAVPGSVAAGGQVAVAAGEYHTCALSSGGAVACWGAGVGSNDPHFGQTAVPGGVAVGGQVAVAAGNYHTCALSAGGAVTCWGRNREGQTAVPSAVAVGGHIAIDAGGLHTCALSLGGAVHTGRRFS